MSVVYVACVIIIIISGSYFEEIKGDRYADLPPIFQIDDYDKCKNDGKLFCKVSVLLGKGSSNVSYYWNLIEQSVLDKGAYNHNELSHAICVEDVCPNLEFSKTKKDDREYLKTYFSECYTEKYMSLGLIANVTFANCSNYRTYVPGAYDYIWLISVMVYLVSVLCATIWEQSNYKQTSSNTIADIFASFSIIANWHKLKQANSDKLRFIQGIRFYNMLFIIFCHTYSSFAGGFIRNTDYIEEISNNPLKLGIRNLFSFLVQTFFLFSGFFLSLSIFQLIEGAGKFNLKYVLLTFINRYIRIIPSVIVILGFITNIWIYSYLNGPIKDIYSDQEYERCQKNWWTALLFINNHYNQKDMCYFIIWYLAADTQLYLLALFVLSLVWKFRKMTTYILMTSVLIGIFIPMLVGYIYNLDIIYRFTPENSIRFEKFRTFEFSATYSSLYSNIATYMLGICSGYIYFKTRDQKLFNMEVYKITWWIMFAGLPIAVLTISSSYYTRFYGAILSGILKPLYALGIAVGILGMSQNVGGIIKSICEWKPATFLANFCYSTYLVHYGVFFRTATVNQPVYVSDFVLIYSFIWDATLSFLFGFILHILFEMPVLKIQNIIIPQVPKQQINRTAKKSE